MCLTGNMDHGLNYSNIVLLLHMTLILPPYKGLSTGKDQDFHQEPHLCVPAGRRARQQGGPQVKGRREEDLEERHLSRWVGRSTRKSPSDIFFFETLYLLLFASYFISFWSVFKIDVIVRRLQLAYRLYRIRKEIRQYFSELQTKFAKVLKDPSLGYHVVWPKHGPILKETDAVLKRWARERTQMCLQVETIVLASFACWYLSPFLIQQVFSSDSGCSKIGGPDARFYLCQKKNAFLCAFNF